MRHRTDRPNDRVPVPPHQAQARERAELAAAMKRHPAGTAKAVTMTSKPTSSSASCSACVGWI